MDLTRSILIWGSLLAASPAVAAAPFTVGDAQTLPVKELAKQLLGEKLSARVIEAVRHNRDGDPAIPEYVEFYTQPEITYPRINGICRTDVITIDYNWFDPDPALKIARIESRPRYKSFPVPPGQLGTEENDKAQAAACAAMTTAVDAFRAPSAGDAQWLAKIHRQYSDPKAQFRFTCLPDTACAEAKRVLPQLALNRAAEVELVDCPPEKTGDVYYNCYRLTFPFAGRDEYSDRSDVHENYAPEWILTVFAGISGGSAPVRLRSVELHHVPAPVQIH